MKSKRETKNSLSQQKLIGNPSVDHLTFDDYADDYVKKTSLDPKTYEGDVQTAFVGTGQVKTTQK